MRGERVLWLIFALLVLASPALAQIVAPPVNPQIVSTPFPVNIISPAPAPTGIPTVIPSCPSTGYPCGLPTPAPYPTSSQLPGTLKSVVTGPSTAPAAKNGGYDAVVDANGRAATRTCDATTSTQCSTIDANGVGVTKVCDATTSTNCVKVATALADNNTTGNAQSTSAYGMLYNAATSFWTRRRNAASPAPTGVPASAYNAAGPAAPIYGTQAYSCGTITTATTTLCVGAVASKVVYNTLVTITAVCTTACSVQFKQGTQTTNPCDTNTSALSGVFWFPNGAGSVSLSGGAGSLAVAPTTAGYQECVVTTGTLTDIGVHIMGEQF
ncbi:MAG: hypothetical protein KGL39_37125 [Patescibacteria group bacterium]|nr:hypothetical protein [Patescibacteria group bacterium]